MKVLFMGTPDFAMVCLDALKNAGHEIVGVVTQPDKPKGRSYKLTPPPVKVYASEHSLPVYQPVTLKDEAFMEELCRMDPDIIVVAAYGKILPKYILDYPKYGCINAHGSVLPYYRGAAPIQRALMNGESETGITVQYMAEGIDTGDIILIEKTPITEKDNFETLHDRLADIAGRALVKAVTMLKDGSAAPEKQDEALATYAEKITKEDCIIDFSAVREKLLCRIRGLSPFPLAVTKTPDGRLLKIVAAEAASGASEAAPGTVTVVDKDGFEVVCADGKKIRIKEVLPEGKGRMSAADFVRGRRIEAGDKLKWKE
ncbi:MAG: methionyl-tRNA formyltransferase [Ruminococcaceae bacterium]|nr:methionyl-tRNA formyltransferase [Oscillospiraceae bacterium]